MSRCPNTRTLFNPLFQSCLKYFMTPSKCFTPKFCLQKKAKCAYYCGATLTIIRLLDKGDCLLFKQLAGSIDVRHRNSNVPYDARE
jgi:hypothetical protein